MSNAPHLGNSKVTFKQNISAGNENYPVEYQVSCWLTFNNGWNDQTNRPNPLTEQQQQAIDELHQHLLNAGIQMQCTIKQKEGQDSRAWPVVARMNLFPNRKQSGGQQGGYQNGGQQGGGWQQTNNSGGGNEW